MRADFSHDLILNLTGADDHGRWADGRGPTGTDWGHREGVTGVQKRSDSEFANSLICLNSLNVIWGFKIGRVLVLGETRYVSGCGHSGHCPRHGFRRKILLNVCKAGASEGSTTTRGRYHLWHDWCFNSSHAVALFGLVSCKILQTFYVLTHEKQTRGNHCNSLSFITFSDFAWRI